MTNKFLSTSAFICVFFLFVPVAGHACDTAKSNTLEQEKSELADLNREGIHATLYNFRTRRCVPFREAHTELEVSAFLPSDETSQGMYQVYRGRGESRVEALKHALAFMIDTQQS
ncbi:MAG TPA: hypothetical protein ENI99_09150 [Sedimenticola sp.]|nr:hypothetical protein [Sedimenticola sp.]